MITRSSKKDALLDAAIESYAKYGEQGLTTKNLAEAAGCSEALIYRHFKSKDDLLCACYLRLHKRLNATFGDREFPDDLSLQETVKLGMDTWMEIFKFYVDAGYESLFCFWFRMSDSFQKFLEEGTDDIKSVYESSFMNIFENLRVKYNFDLSAEHYRTYVVFATGTFVGQVVTGKLPKTEESYETIRNLLFGGLLSTVPGYSVDKILQ